MNTKLIINELNREPISIDKLKKATYITDDYKMIDTLKKAIELGVSNLDHKIVKSKFGYIINSIEYLKILYSLYPDKQEEIEECLIIVRETVRYILEQKNTKKNDDYYWFIKEIFDNLDVFLECIKQENKTIQSIYDYLDMIDNRYEDIEKIDEIILKKLINNYIQQLLKIKEIGVVLYEVKDIFVLIQHVKLKSDKKRNKLVRILEEQYKELHSLVEAEYSKKLNDYINKNYKEDLELFNPWIITDSVEEPQPFIITIDRRNSFEMDDAIAVVRNQYGITLHVYISNTTPFLMSNPNYEQVALERYSSMLIRTDEYKNLYSMLPRECSAQLSLRENEIRNVIDHTFYLDPFGRVSYSFSYKNITVNKRLTYQQADKIMENSSEEEQYLKRYLNSLERCVKEIYLKLGLNEIYKMKEKKEEGIRGKARKIISRTALLVNYINAKEATKNNYLLLYQDYYNGKYSASAPENPYIKITSPIRRYSDLKNNYLLYHYIKNDLTDGEYYQIEKELQEMIPFLEERRERNKVFCKIGNGNIL